MSGFSIRYPSFNRRRSSLLSIAGYGVPPVGIKKKVKFITCSVNLIMNKLQMTILCHFKRNSVRVRVLTQTYFLLSLVSGGGKRQPEIRQDSQASLCLMSPSSDKKGTTRTTRNTVIPSQTIICSPKGWIYNEQPH